MNPNTGTSFSVRFGQNQTLSIAETFQSRFSKDFPVA